MEEARKTAIALVDEWRYGWRGMKDACMTANRIDLIDRITRAIKQTKQEEVPSDFISAKGEIVDYYSSERNLDWVLKELADGWIESKERDGFYRNARRVLKDHCF